MHSSMLRRVLRIALTFTLITGFSVAALFIGLRYLLLPRIDTFRPQIETFVSQKLHAELHIGKLAPYWSGSQPGIKIDGLTIRSGNGQLALSVPHATAVLSWRSLTHLKLILSSLVVDQPDVLAERTANNTLFIAGVAVPPASSSDHTFTTWVLQQGVIVLRGGTLRWRDALRATPELRVAGLRATLLNHGATHKFALQAPANSTLLRGPLDFRVRFTHHPFAAIGKPSNWNGNAYLSAIAVDLPTLARYVELPLTTFSGRLDNTLWATFNNAHLSAAHGTLHGYDLGLRMHPAQPRLDLFDGRFAWDLSVKPQDYTLKLSQLHAELNQPPLSDGTSVTRAVALTTLTARYRAPTAEHGQLINLAGDRVDLNILNTFVRALPLPARFRDVLARYDPTGLIANYQMEFERASLAAAERANQKPADEAAPLIRYHVKGDLQGIGSAAQLPPPGLSPEGHPRLGIPGVENIWGHLEASETQGSITIDTTNAAITLLGALDAPRLMFDPLRGQANWTIKPAPGEPWARIDLTVPTLYAANPDLAFSAAGHYTNPGYGRGALDLKATLDRALVTRIGRYLPLSLSASLRQYIDHALQAGTITRGATITARGPLIDFPYARKPNAGVFHIIAPFTKGAFEPTPQPQRALADGTPNVWPALNHIDGIFELKQNLLRIDIERARYRHFVLGKTHVRIDDLAHSATSPLRIEGHGQGPLADLLDYMNHSAVSGITKHIGEKIHARGPAKLALKLSIPLHQAPAQVGIDGIVMLAGNTLETPGIPPVSEVRGKLRFTEHQLTFEDMTARLLGGPLRSSGSIMADGRYAFDLNGQITIEETRKLEIPAPATALLERVTGSAPYQITIRGARAGLPEITAHAKLVNAGIDFPEPLAKPAGTPMSLDFMLKPAHGNGTALEQASFTVGAIAATYLLDMQPGQPIRAVRGTLGMNRSPGLPADGVIAAIDMTELDADAWLTFFRALRAADHTSAALASPAQIDIASFIPQRFALHFGTLKLFQRNWENVIVGASHVDKSWQANIASNQISGYLSWIPGHAANDPGVVNARLAKLVIPESIEHDLVGPAMEVTAPANHALPSINLIADQVFARGYDIGQLKVNAHNADEAGIPVWQLDKLELTNPAAKLTATGSWRTSRHALARGIHEPDAPRRTVYSFTLEIDDAGALLDRVGLLPNTFAAGRGTLAGKVGWRGGPTEIDYPTLTGHLGLELRNGRVLKIDLGAAKLLTLFSLRNLPHLLRLDFRTLLGKGLPFEKITGTSQITRGVAFTNDLKIAALLGDATFTGQTDLLHHTLALQTFVAPKIDIGLIALPIAFFDPLFGVGILATDLVLSPILAHALSRYYTLTGSWAQPHIERISSDPGKMDSTTPSIMTN